MMAYVLVSGPQNEPLTLDEIKAQLTIATSDFDALLSLHLRAARKWVERVTGLSLLTQTWDLYLDTFPDVLRLERNPVQSVTYLKYFDTDGTERTLAAGSDYTLDLKSMPARIVPAYGKNWPATRAVPNAVNVRFVAGYTSADHDALHDVKLAIILLCAHWFEHREQACDEPLHDIPMGAHQLVAPHIVFEVDQ